MDIEQASIRTILQLTRLVDPVCTPRRSIGLRLHRNHGRNVTNLIGCLRSPRPINNLARIEGHVVSDSEFDHYRPPFSPVGKARTVEPGAEVIERSPWLTIWTSPRQTIRKIVVSDPDRGVMAIGVVMGFCMCLNLASRYSLGDRISFTWIVPGCLAMGAIVGPLSLQIFGDGAWRIGDWLGGRGSRRSAVAAVAWGNVPILWGLVGWALLIGTFGPGNFESSGFDFLDPAQGEELELGILLVSILQTVASFALTTNTLAEVHQISLRRGFAILVLWNLMVLIFAIGLGYLI
ncbi:Yip1 family protein [Tundrisphaera lichenicola]|uniref:Yip1 family protein n=1 Tax=Tundrisphaera lichenicola TaxID=2029860 RepID=UPI003EC0DB9A